jgi:hypothetical protein
MPWLPGKFNKFPPRELPQQPARSDPPAVAHCVSVTPVTSATPTTPTTPTTLTGPSTRYAVTRWRCPDCLIPWKVLIHVDTGTVQVLNPQPRPPPLRIQGRPTCEEMELNSYLAHHRAIYRAQLPSDYTIMPPRLFSSKMIPAADCPRKQLPYPLCKTRLVDEPLLVWQHRLYIGLPPPLAFPMKWVAEESAQWNLPNQPPSAEMLGKAFHWQRLGEVTLSSNEKLYLQWRYMAYLHMWLVESKDPPSGHMIGRDFPCLRFLGDVKADILLVQMGVLKDSEVWHLYGFDVAGLQLLLELECHHEIDVLEKYVDQRRHLRKEYFEPARKAVYDAVHAMSAVAHARTFSSRDELLELLALKTVKERLADLEEALYVWETHRLWRD